MFSATMVTRPNLPPTISHIATSKHARLKRRNRSILRTLQTSSDKLSQRQKHDSIRTDIPRDLSIAAIASNELLRIRKVNAVNMPIYKAFSRHLRVVWEGLKVPNLRTTRRHENLTCARLARKPNNTSARAASHNTIIYNQHVATAELIVDNIHLLANSVDSVLGAVLDESAQDLLVPRYATNIRFREFLRDGDGADDACLWHCDDAVD